MGWFCYIVTDLLCRGVWDGVGSILWMDHCEYLVSNDAVFLKFWRISETVKPVARPPDPSLRTLIRSSRRFLKLWACFSLGKSQAVEIPIPIPCTNHAVILILRVYIYYHRDCQCVAIGHIRESQNGTIHEQCLGRLFQFHTRRRGAFSALSFHQRHIAAQYRQDSKRIERKKV